MSKKSPKKVTEPEAVVEAPFGTEGEPKIVEVAEPAPIERTRAQMLTMGQSKKES